MWCYIFAKMNLLLRVGSSSIFVKNEVEISLYMKMYFHFLFLWIVCSYALPILVLAIGSFLTGLISSLYIREVSHLFGIWLANTPFKGLFFQCSFLLLNVNDSHLPVIPFVAAGSGPWWKRPSPWLSSSFLTGLSVLL